MRVKADKGLYFKLQGQYISDTKVINVNVDHNVKVMLAVGSLIEVVDEPVKESNTTKNKKQITVEEKNVVS